MAADTPNHAIRDGDFPIIYVSGDKGLYKFFTDTNEIVLMKAVSAGEQGLMVGYAGLLEPPDDGPIDPDNPAVRLITTVGTADSGGIIRRGVWEYTKQLGWVNKRGNLPLDVEPAMVTANPVSRDTWAVILTNNIVANFDNSGGALLTVGQTYSPIWITQDAGITWQEVPITFDTTPGDTGTTWTTGYGGFQSIEWAHDGSSLCVAMPQLRAIDSDNYDSERGGLYRQRIAVALISPTGTVISAEVARPTERPRPEYDDFHEQLDATYIAAGPVGADEFVLQMYDISGTAWSWKGYVTSAGQIVQPEVAETLIAHSGAMEGFIDSFPGSSVAHMTATLQEYRPAGSGGLQAGEHWSVDAHSTAPWVSDGRVLGDSLAVLDEGLAFGFRSILTFGGGLWVNGVVYEDGRHIGNVRADRQTHTLLGLTLDAISPTPAVYKNGAVVEIPEMPNGLYPGAGISTVVFVEPIVGDPADWNPTPTDPPVPPNPGDPPPPPTKPPGTGLPASRVQMAYQYSGDLETETGTTVDDGGIWYVFTRPNQVIAYQMTVTNFTEKVTRFDLIGNNEGDPAYYNAGIAAAGDTLHFVWLVGGTSIKYRTRPYNEDYSDPVTIVEGLSGATCVVMASGPTSNILIVAWKPASGPIAYTRSTNGGSNWTAGLLPAEAMPAAGAPIIMRSHEAERMLFQDEDGAVIEAVYSGGSWTLHDTGTPAGMTGIGYNISPEGRRIISYRAVSGVGLHYAVAEEGSDTWAHHELLFNNLPIPYLTDETACAILDTSLAYVHSLDYYGGAMHHYMRYGDPADPTTFESSQRASTGPNKMSHPHSFAHEYLGFYKNYHLVVAPDSLTCLYTSLYGVEV